MFIVPQEILLYLWFFHFIVVGKNRFTVDLISKSYCLYGMLFLVQLVFVCVSSGKVLTSHDIYVLRLIFQVAISASLFSYYFAKNRDIIYTDKFIIYIIAILTLPAIIAMTQMSDIFGAKEIIQSLYKTQGGFLSVSDLSEYRVASVFKSYYNATIYYLFVCAFCFYLANNVSTNRSIRLYILLAFFINFSAQFITGRTGLVFVPVLACGIYLLYSYKGPQKASSAFTLLLIIAVLFFIGFFGDKYFDQYAWVLEIYKLLKPSELDTFSSYQDMGTMNAGFINYLKKDLSILFYPNHTYDVSYTSSKIYTDNFYLQEVYRYGLYGITAYLAFVSYLIYNSCKTSKYVLISVFVLLILNYKGGNTFIMDRNIYLYSFLFVITSLYDLQSGKNT